MNHHPPAALHVGLSAAGLGMGNEACGRLALMAANRSV